VPKRKIPNFAPVLYGIGDVNLKTKYFDQEYLPINSVSKDKD
jgi:hypothetical protein